MIVDKEYEQGHFWAVGRTGGGEGKRLVNSISYCVWRYSIISILVWTFFFQRIRGGTPKNESKFPNPKTEEIGIGSGVVWGCVSGRSVTPDDRSDGRALLVPQLGLLKIELVRSIFGTGKKCDDSPTCGHLKKPWMQSPAHWVAPSSEKEELNFRSF